jgi:NADH-quinone oxidoreductase subunit N
MSVFSPLVAVIPVLVVTLSACAVLVNEAFRRPGDRLPPFGFGLFGVIGLGGAVISSALLWDRNQIGLGVVTLDNFAIFFNIAICGMGLLTVLVSAGSAERDELPLGEYYALMLCAIGGMMLMGSTNDLLVIFLALEIMSLAVYVMTGIKRASVQGAEASFKYLVLGAFSSAFFLYGIALIYAATGTTRLEEVGMLLAGQAMQPDLLTIGALVMLLVGLGFKVSAVPFHMWTPDAYQGAPTLVTGFMSTGVKAAAFAAFVRIFLSALEPLQMDWVPVLSALAALTMVLGTVVGVAQNSVKRMLAYSSIAHAGYLLVGLVAAGQDGKAAILFYVVAYGVTNLGAFGVLAALSTPERPHDDVRDFAGLGREQPGVAALLTVFLLSLGGFPPTVGFVAKWYVFAAALQQQYVALAVLGVLTSVIAVFFYLRMIVVFYLGVLPGELIDVARESAASVF